MGERKQITFGDFSQEEANHIRALSTTIQGQLAKNTDDEYRSISNRHYTDALSATKNEQTPNPSTNYEDQDEILTIYPSDDDFMDETDNFTQNNNKNGPNAGPTQVNSIDRFHSIPQITSSI